MRCVEIYVIEKEWQIHKKEYRGLIAGNLISEMHIPLTSFFQIHWHLFIDGTPRIISRNSITAISATCAGTNVVANSSAVSAYGIEYSTTNGFPNGTGTQVASANLAGGNFTSNLTGLTPTTTYYYKAYATNTGGTTYGLPDL